MLPGRTAGRGWVVGVRRTGGGEGAAPASPSLSVLPTSWLFGRLSQTGPNKKWSGRPMLRPNFGWSWTKRAKKGPNCNPSLILGKCPRIIVIFPCTQTKNSVFLEPKFLQKGKLLGDWIFVLGGRIFFSGLAENLCKELATLVPVQAGNGALDTQQHHRYTADQHNTAQVKNLQWFLVKTNSTQTQS